MAEDGQPQDHGDGLVTIKNPLSMRTLLETHPEPMAVTLVSFENLPEFGNLTHWDHWVFLVKTEDKYYHGVVILKKGDGEKVDRNTVWDLFFSKEEEGSSQPYTVRPIVARPR